MPNNLQGRDASVAAVWGVLAVRGALSSALAHLAGFGTFLTAAATLLSHLLQDAVVLHCIAVTWGGGATPRETDCLHVQHVKQV